MEDLHDFRNYAWRAPLVRPQRGLWRSGGQNVQTIPANTFLPVIMGIPTQGQVLITSTGTWTQGPITYSYQWLRDGLNISAATSNTYTLAFADVGHMVTVAVKATNQFGTSFPVDARALGPIAATLGISGTPVTSATEGVPYPGFTVSATGGWTPLLFNVAAGLLPTPITVNPVTGVVSGPRVTGTTGTNIVITVTDRYGLTANLPPFTITVAEFILDSSGNQILDSSGNPIQAG